ncbi:glycosyltransferase [Telluribacter humicola]|uniref:glycosyltransferase n=1 Tax=Telluribacter humicola TaxID=1720261 RepID=UPI001A966F2D|nr:glycosyltransferase [Telluribacter humicola]
MAELLLAILGFFILIQLFYYLFVFTRLIGYKQYSEPGPDAPAVTVLVCAWNELENLQELLPLLDAQEYPTFEVLVLDDRSTDGSHDFLKKHVFGWDHVRFIRIDTEVKHITPKKYALSVGMKHAQYPIALMTDADCRPVGNNWISSMVAQLTNGKDIVLGFSPYMKKGGLLNWFIRCETFYTAVQYLSFARVGWPYMGVGRNLMYKKSLFFEHKGFYTHKGVVGGDDDLFMNQAATPDNTVINLDPESFMYSVPKTSWGSWFTQKRRHLSVGKLYKPKYKTLLGLLSGSHVGLWLAGIACLVHGLLNQDLLLLQILGGAFAFRWLVQLIVLGGINRRLDRTVGAHTFIFMDLAFFIYYIFMSLMMFRKPKKETKWR